MKDGLENANGIVSAGLVALTVYGLTLQEWAALAAFIYTVWILAEKAWHKWVAYRTRRDAARQAEARARTRQVVERVVAHRDSDEG